MVAPETTYSNNIFDYTYFIEGVRYTPKEVYIYLTNTNIININN